MSRESLVDLLVKASSRPHSRCLRYRNVEQKRTYALAQPKRKGDSNVKQPATPPAVPARASPQVPISTPRQSAAPRPPSAVPLAVGLDRNPTGRSAISKIPIPQGVKDEKFVPQPLARPLGLSIRPAVGQNSPIDARTGQEKKAEALSRDTQLEQRQVLFRSFLRPYYQERNRVDADNKGKSFISNERLFRKDKALYFPNMYGQPLANNTDAGDTTPSLMGKVTVVAISSNTWAQEMVNSFISKESNAELHNLLQSFPRLQRAHVNVQVDAGRAWLQSLYSYKLRSMYPEQEWQRFWFVKAAQDTQRGLTDEIRDAMGYLNTHVGYVYLLDEECKIRWAGSGQAWSGEVDHLNMGIKRLISELSDQ